MTTTPASSSLGLMASAPRRAAALRSTIAPAAVGIVTHTLTLVALVTVGIRSSADSPAELLAGTAPIALAIGITAALVVIMARQLGCARTRPAVIAGVIAALIPLATVVFATLSRESPLLVSSPAVLNDTARYLCLCLPFVAFALVIALGSARMAGRQVCPADRG